MSPRIEILPPKKLIGKHLKMSLSKDRTYELWHSFMPTKKEIKNNLTHDLFNIKVCADPLYFKEFNPHLEFIKWAAIEVPDFDFIPENMEAFNLLGGLYAVFIHKGPATAFPETLGHIFNSWLPNSGYELDNRPHFEILGEKYKNNALDSEEEVWIPIKEKF